MTNFIGLNEYYDELIVLRQRLLERAKNVQLANQQANQELKVEDKLAFQIAQDAANSNTYKVGLADVVQRKKRTKKTIIVPANLVQQQQQVEQEAATADYFVIVYNFSTGRDLDTRTSLRNPINGSLSNTIGWCKDSIIQYNDLTVASWGGDNTGTGAESALIDKLAYQTAFGGAWPIKIRTAGFWYRELGGNINIELTGYLGGKMELSGYTWINPTATKVFKNFSTYTASTNINISQCVEGDFFTYVNIDPTVGRVTYTQS